MFSYSAVLQIEDVNLRRFLLVLVGSTDDPVNIVADLDQLERGWP